MKLKLFEPKVAQESNPKGIQLREVIGNVSPMNPSLRSLFPSVVKNICLAFVTAILLTGCALKTPPLHSQLVTNSLPTTTSIPVGWIAGGNTNVVGDNWLKTFNDPGLNAVVTEAITNNLDLRQASARVEAARQMAIVVGARLKPRIGADFNVATTRDDGRDDWFNSTKALAGAAWEPDIWGKLRSQRDASEASYEATALDFAYGRQSLAATVAKSWYLTVETRQLLGIAHQTVGIYSNLLDLVKLRRDAGKVADLDVSEANANFHAAQSGLRSAEGLYSETRRSLEVLLGRYPADELSVAEKFAVAPPPIAAGLPSSLLERRPDIVAAEKSVLSAFRSEEAAKLALLPSFTLNLDGGRLGDNLLSVLGANPWMFNAALGMSVPIYTGGALRAKVEIATARQQEAVAGYGAAALTAFREVENGLMNEDLYKARLALDEEVLGDRTESVRIATLKYEAGSIDLLPLLQLQAAQIASHVNIIKLRNAQLANRIDLHLSLGGSFESAPAIAVAEVNDEK